MAARGLLVLAVVLAFAGCGPSPGAAGLWDLRVGGSARIVAEDGASGVVVEDLAAPTSGKRRPRKGEVPKVEPVSLEVGTRVSVLAIDGDDARVRIEEGRLAGSIHWIECRLLTAD